MDLILLGTGNAVATDCYNTCFVLEDDSRPALDRYLLVDGGGGNGLLSQLKSAEIDWQVIRTLFVTHAHMDHVMGIFWMVRMILMGMTTGTYQGEAVVYGHDEAIQTVRKAAKMLLSKKQCSFLDTRLHLIPVTDGESREVLGRRITFFDIRSTKTKQFGFSIELGGVPEGAPAGVRPVLTCCGDEPCHESGRPYADHAAWLLHEAFCLYGDADRFCPYEKNHSTVKDAAELAEELQIANLVLYHTEDLDLTHRKARYSEEGSRYYHGHLWVPDDLERIRLL